MTKECAYTYDAGYRDGSTNYELEHCPACNNVVDLQEALAENAKLRDENARLRSCLSDDADNARQIMGENAQLRELVRDLVRWNGAEHHPHEELQFWGDKNRGVYARMRELGMEVDE